MKRLNARGRGSSAIQNPQTSVGENRLKRIFAGLLVEKFGAEQMLRKEARLMNVVEELRSDLFQVQVEGHAWEIHRILDKERGRAYLSLEMFRTVPGTKDEHYPVSMFGRALENLGRYFHFDFQSITPERALRASKIGEGISIIQSLVLKPIGRLAGEG